MSRLECNGICLVSGPDIHTVLYVKISQTNTVACTPAMTGNVFMRKFRLFWDSQQPGKIILFIHMYNLSSPTAKYPKYAL